MENYFTTKLSPEIILKILLYLNCDELSAIKRTCHYFNCFIEANRDELAKKEFTNISIINPKEEKIKYKKVDIRNGVVPHSPSLGQFKNLLKNLNFANARTLYQDCIANREPIFENEWNAAIKNCTSVYIRTGRDKVIYPSLEKLAIKLAFSRMDSQRNQKQNKLRSMEFYHKEIAKLHGNLVLKLPVFPKTIVEMKIIRFWLRKLFNCKFREVLFGQYIINPEIIEILFDKEELEKLQFHTQIAHLTYCNTVSLYYHEGFRKIMTYDHEIDMVFKFNVKHLRISQLLSLDARYYKETPQNNDILLKLFSKGAKIPHIQINYDWKLTICNLIIKYLQSLSNYTKIVPIIVLDKTPVLRGSLDINLFIRKECSSGLIIYYKEYIKNNIKILIEFYLDDSERVIKAKFRKFK